MKIKKIELALFLFLSVLMAYTATVSYQQRELAENVVRLRVVANGNDLISQSQKLYVRDAVLESCAVLLQDAADADDVRNRLCNNIEILENAVQRVVGKNPFCIRISECRYPTRKYQKFALPSGRYLGVQVLLGGANGKNWWCVLYPSLCVGGDSTADSRYDETTFSFKCMEWVSALCEYLWE